MKKNIIFWVGVINPDHKDKYGDYSYFEYSKNTWKYFCKKFDCHFVEFNTPIEKDLFKFRVNWQKAIFVFDELEKKGIKYDQIALVDSSCMYKWDAPNFFELTERKFTGWRDIDNMRWTNDSIMGYKSFFNNFELDRTKYINSGFIIFNESHKTFFNSFKQLYYDNVDEFCKLQDKVVKKGTEQTPLNYWLQINKIKVKIDLPIAFKLTHLHRKEMFSYNWQLNEDKTPYFIKYGYNWIFNGLPKHDRSNIMKQVWNLVKHNYADNVLDKVVHKDTHKFTTSRKFKEDILKYFGKEYKDKTLVELGCCQGTTTRVYAECFEKVIGVDKDKWNIDQAKNNCKDVSNVEFYQQDLYNEEWKFPKADVVVIDAGHTYEHIISDVPRVIEYFNNPIIILDDYGNPNQSIRKGIDELVNKNILNIEHKIGSNSGFKTATGLVFNDMEGIICKT
jgi:2-polyprenyl-3-methyl-5-hydroxy-6-metoxy-1,4-benzoquinol methylase